jgi:hypothetical protein
MSNNNNVLLEPGALCWWFRGFFFPDNNATKMIKWLRYESELRENSQRRMFQKQRSDIVINVLFAYSRAPYNSN